MAQIVTLEGVLGTDELWHYALSVYLFLIVVCFLPYTWFPESPKYLYIVANKRDEARKGKNFQPKLLNLKYEKRIIKFT